MTKYKEAPGATTVQHMHDEQGSMTIVREYGVDGAVTAMRVYFDGELGTEEEHAKVKALLDV